MSDENQKITFPFSDDVMKELNERQRKKQFEFGATWPISWKFHAYKFKHAADHLYEMYYAANHRIIEKMIADIKENPTSNQSRTLEGQELRDFYDSSLIGIYFLLMGYALENLVKAICMIVHPEYFTPNKLTGIKTHNLRELCTRCSIDLDKDELILLDKLSEYVEWMGKYPIPLELGKMYPKQQSNGTWKHRGEAFHGREAQQEVDELYTKLLTMLESFQAPN